VYDGLDETFNPNRSNLFNYNQDVVSAYGTYGFAASKKVNFKLGARVEDTRIKGTFEQQQSENSGVKQHYTNVLPNMSVSYQPQNPKKPGETVRVAYSQRIQRPQIFFLNPFVNASDTLNISYGNPDLNPELTHSVELNYTTFIKGSVLNMSAYMRRTNKAIETVRFIDANGVNNQTFRNIGRNATYGELVWLGEASAEVGFERQRERVLRVVGKPLAQLRRRYH
jgi:ferric enterobactin receptor